MTDTPTDNRVYRIVCPHCGAANGWAVPDDPGVFQCAQCGHSFEYGDTPTDPVEAVARTLCCGVQCTKPSRCRCDFKATEARRAIRAYREALEASGWQVVPKEPTDAMLTALHKEWWNPDRDGNPTAFDLYKAVLSAAPTPEDRDDG